MSGDVTKAVVDGGGDQTLLTWLLGAAFALLTGAFGFTQRQIATVRRETREDLDAMEATLVERLREGRSDRENIWREIRENQKTMEEQHRRMLERMGNVVTREDLRQDLHAHEARMTQILQNAESRRH